MKILLLVRGLPDDREREEEDTAEGVGGVAHQVRQEAALLAITFISLAENCPHEVESEEEVYQKDQYKTLSYGVDSPILFQGRASRAHRA